jgi:hypothetical protein
MPISGLAMRRVTDGVMSAARSEAVPAIGDGGLLAD